LSTLSNSRILRCVLALGYVSGVFWGGVIDIGPLPKLPELPTDKVLHALVFMGLELVIEFALLDLGARRRRFIGVLGSITVGGLLELVQAALPYRSAEFLDWLADSAGALLGALITYLALRWRWRPRVAGAR
jgi:VanZ family protein